MLFLHYQTTRMNSPTHAYGVIGYNDSYPAPGNYFSRRLSAVVRPSYMTWLYDASGSWDTYINNANPLATTPEQNTNNKFIIRHLKAGNILCVDGHVERSGFSDFVAARLLTN